MLKKRTFAIYGCWFDHCCTAGDYYGGGNYTIGGENIVLGENPIIEYAVFDCGDCIDYICYMDVV
ncbi:MAG: hypothetical protein PHN80_11210 [Hespellia sp.]|nr:hypothetical protein [Hespellia sp.]